MPRKSGYISATANAVIGQKFGRNLSRYFARRLNESAAAPTANSAKRNCDKIMMLCVTAKYI